jgi:type II secretory pathway component PulJ
LERARAFSDIADMGGRTFASVQRQANVVAAKAREAERQRRMVALVPMVIRAHAPVALPSTLNTGAAFLARRTGSRA